MELRCGRVLEFVWVEDVLELECKFGWVGVRYRVVAWELEFTSGCTYNNYLVIFIFEKFMFINFDSSTASHNPTKERIYHEQDQAEARLTTTNIATKIRP